MAFAYNELRPGMFVILDGEPWEVKEAEFLRMQQRKPVMRTTLKHCATGKAREHTFHQSDTIPEAELEKMPAQFIYESRGAYWFHEKGNPGNRFSFSKDDIADIVLYVRKDLEATALTFEGRILSIVLPIKVEYEVTEAPPAIRGDTAQGGTKQVVIASGANVATPLFIGTGDIIVVNTQTGQYVERIKKAA
ncbi:MAG: hypothetical protein AAB581_04265 [Patescibacteria group bacterium]